MSYRNALFYLVTVILAGAAAGQTRIDLSAQSKAVDFSGASSTKPFQTGTALPASCTTGQMYFLTTEVNGQNTYGCVGNNTWVRQSAGAQSTTIKSSGVLVGARQILDVSAGRGAVLSTSDDGQELYIQTSIDTSVVQTQADEQAGSTLLCKSSSTDAPGVTYSCALTPTLTAYTTGMVLNWQPDASNAGGATTLNVDLLGAAPVVRADGVTPLGSSDIVTGEMYQIWYDGAAFRLLSGSGGGGTGQSQPAGALAPNGEYSTSRVMDSSYCPNWMGTFTGSSPLTFTLGAPVPGCVIVIQNNTTQPMAINVTTNAALLNGQMVNGNIPACATPASGCRAAVIKANGTTSWDMSGGGGIARNIGVIFAGGDLVSGAAINIPSIDFSCTLSKATISADAGTAATIKLWKSAGAEIPGPGDSISTSGFSLAGSTKFTTTSMADLTTTSVAAGDSLTFDLAALNGSPSHIAIVMECDQ